MKNKILVFITILLSLSLMAAVTTMKSTNTSNELEIRYKYRLQKFKSELATFKSVVLNNPHKEKIVNQYRAVRNAFKQWEYHAFANQWNAIHTALALPRHKISG